MSEPKKEVGNIIPLKKGIEIEHACKKYTHKTGIPEKIHKAIYGNAGDTDAEKKRIYATKLKKHKAAKEKPEPVKDESESMKDEPKNTSK